MSKKDGEALAEDEDEGRASESSALNSSIASGTSAASAIPGPRRTLSVRYHLRDNLNQWSKLFTMPKKPFEKEFGMFVFQSGPDWNVEEVVSQLFHEIPRIIPTAKAASSGLLVISKNIGQPILEKPADNDHDYDFTKAAVKFGGAPGSRIVDLDAVLAAQAKERDRIAPEFAKQHKKHWKSVLEEVRKLRDSEGKYLHVKASDPVFETLAPVKRFRHAFGGGATPSTGDI